MKLQIILFILLIILLIGCTTKKTEDLNFGQQNLSTENMVINIIEDNEGLNLRFDTKRQYNDIYSELFFCNTKEGEIVKFSLISGTKSGWVQIPNYLTYNRPNITCGISFYKCSREEILHSSLNKCDLKMNDIENMNSSFTKTTVFNFR